MTTVVVIAKQPVPGRVKTRLVPPLRHVDAADLAAAALRDTLDAVDGAAADRRVLAFDGDPTGWLRADWDLVRQPTGGLDERLAAAFDEVGPGPAVLVGMDTPQLPSAYLDVVDLVRHDACLGLATDGGFWAIGFADPRSARAAIVGVPMSTGHTGSVQLQRLVDLGLKVQMLPELTDVDTAEVAASVAAAAPGTRFAAHLATLKIGA
jgi:glycosyltransferase A (GT-A) superfamily protein (DUF2064 family)